MTDVMLGVREVSEELDVARPTVIRYIKAGVLKAEREGLDGRTMYQITAASLRDFKKRYCCPECGRPEYSVASRYGGANG